MVLSVANRYCLDVLCSRLDIKCCCKLIAQQPHSIREYMSKGLLTLMLDLCLPGCHWTCLKSRSGTAIVEDAEQPQPAYGQVFEATLHTVK